LAELTLRYGLCSELCDGTGSEDQAMSRSPELEISELVAFLDLLALLKRFSLPVD
jgi:hypothetical protein